MRRLYSIVLVLLIAISAMAQAVDCPTEMVKGRLMYKYKVHKGDGLYGLSLRFGVSQEEIVKHNPQLGTQGLRFDEYVYIPVKEADMAEVGGIKMVEHTVAPKETVYGIARQYGSTEAAILAANPVESKRMFVGDVLKVPTGTPAQLKQYAENAQREAKVKAEEANKAAEKPVEPVAPVAPIAPVVPVAPAVSEATEAPIAPAVPEETHIANTDDAIRLVYLLPLMAESQKRDAQMDRFVDFYEGALLAVREWQEKNHQTVLVSTYDTQKSEERLYSILQQPALKEANAIIGPALPSEVVIAAKHAAQYRIPTLIPFTQKVPDLSLNPYLMQFNPSIKWEAEVLAARWGQKGNVHCVFLGTEGAELTPSVQALMSKVQVGGLSYTLTPLRTILSDSLQYFLEEGKENVLIFNTDKYASLQVFMPRVTQLSEQYQLMLYSHYSWQHERMPISQVYTTVFGTPDKEKLNQYTMDFERYYGKHTLASVLPRYDLLGYDLTYALLLRLAGIRAHQAEWPDEKEEYFYQGLQSAIDFMPITPGGGLENVEVRMEEK